MKRTRRWQALAALVATGAFAFGLALHGAPPEGQPAKDQAGVAGVSKITAGPGIPKDGSIPMLPPVVVDYRVKAPVTAYGQGAQAIGAADLTHWELFGGFLKARTAGDPCLIDEQCYTCNVCIEYSCDDFICVENVLQNETGVDGCDDGDYCNGEEECTGGTCVADPDGGPCSGDETCDEGADECLPPSSLCATNPDCNDDLFCTDDTCRGDGVCVYTNACGPEDARCLEPQPPATGPVCIEGRCCTYDTGTEMWNCTRETYTDCVNPPPDPAGLWLPVGNADTTCGDDGAQCPKYGGGIFSDSNWTALIGPISHLNCDNLVTVGDDYKTYNYDTDPYMLVEAMRWVGSVEPPASARWSIEFRDASGLFIENVFYPGGVNDGAGLAIRTVIFSPPLAIPTDGIVSFTVQANFGLDGRVNLAATDVIDVGSNNADAMYVQKRGEADGSIRDYLGICSGGDRNGLVCDTGEGHLDCPNGGNCGDVDDFLAFELIGTKTTAPEGACCDSETGDCTKELPWVCAGRGDYFQTVGSECGLCVGTGTPCSTDDECDPPEPDSCEPLPTCLTQACCDADTGDCIETMGPDCSGKVCDNDPSNYTCTQNADCPEGGTCVDLTGTSSLGFGTDCDPNCCEQPDYDGANNCNLVTINDIDIPPLGPDTASITLTGDNSGAIYDDFVFVCMGGPFDGNVCETNMDCGECVNACQLGGNNGERCFIDADCPDPFPGACVGGNSGEPCAQDTDCPDFVIGFCDGAGTECDQWCNSGIFNPEGNTRDPGWWNAFTIYAQCTGGGNGGERCVEDTDCPDPFEGACSNPCAEVRVDLCCTDIDGDVLRPAWGNLYIGCPCAQILQNVGVQPPIGMGRGTPGFARGPDFCVEDNLWQTYLLEAGTYYYPIYSAPGGTSGPPGAEYQLHVTVKRCAIAACCLGHECLYANEIECDEMGGYWLFGNVECGTDPNCAEPPGTSSNPCCTGSCCRGPGVCDDEVPPPGSGIPMTEGDCDLLEGAFVGGIGCGGRPVDAMPPPCPACPITDDTNCQDWDDTYVWLSDWDAGAYGTRRADDFVAKASTISQVCVIGTYIDAVERLTMPRYDCACQGDDVDNCIPEVDDDFHVTIYADAASVPGVSSFPGAMLHTTTASSARELVDEYANFDTWETGLLLDDPYTFLETNVVYWIEVANDTGGPDPDNVCSWYWNGNIEGGNDYSVYDANGVWSVADTRGMELGFCIDQVVNAPTAPPGACCLCDPLGDCSEATTLAECEDLVGDWRIDQLCAAAMCPQTRPLGDDCETDRIVLPPILDGNYEYSNVCAISDGPEDTCDTQFGSDLWYEYYVPFGCVPAGNGRLTVTMCPDAGADSDYDAILALHHDPATPTVCPPCPTVDGENEVDCGDDNCGIGGGPPFAEANVEGEGECYLIRLGGWLDTDGGVCGEGCQGAGNFRVTCVPLECTPSSPAVPDPSPSPSDIGFGGKTRYMSFSGGDEGMQQAIRVTFTDMPGYEYAQGRQMWVQEPYLMGEPSGSPAPTADNNFWAAQLDCDPYYTDWSTFGTVDVHGVSIVPSATYTVQVLSNDCNPADEAGYSAPLLVEMSKRGDIVGDCGVRPCTAPQGIVDFIDISSDVEKFKNDPGAPRKARADVVNSDVTKGYPDGVIDFVDISCTVDAFRNNPTCALSGPPDVDPCD